VCGFDAHASPASIVVVRHIDDTEDHKDSNANCPPKLVLCESFLVIVDMMAHTVATLTEHASPVAVPGPQAALALISPEYTCNTEGRRSHDVEDKD
jgi:hypothetical protein